MKKPPQQKVSIILENKDFLIVNKPAGLIVHADGKTVEPTLVDWINKNYPKIKGVGEPLKLSTGVTIDRPGIVHRLDRDTSGVMVIAKTQKAFEFLKDKFQTRDIHKTYEAFVYGQIKEEEGRIDRPITRSRKDFRLWSAQRGGRGDAREATTDFKVLYRGSAPATDPATEAPLLKAKNIIYEPFTFVQVSPVTGRTHQIRVHMKAINHPLIGDHLYAPKRPALLGFKRVALHARRIEFKGLDGKKVKAEAPYPHDFSHALALLQLS